MHKARHTAGQRVLDASGNLKAVQELLGHFSIQTTGDIYPHMSHKCRCAERCDSTVDKAAASFAFGCGPFVFFGDRRASCGSVCARHVMLATPRALDRADPFVFGTD
jgi:Phage integrase family